MHTSTASRPRSNIVATHAWHAIVAGSVSLALCVLALGRTDPVHPSLTWVATFALLFLALFGWLARFSHRLVAGKAISAMPVSIRVHLPLAALSLLATTAIYASDSFNHQVANFLQPTAPLIVLLALFATIVAESAAVRGVPGSRWNAGEAIEESARWAIPASLVLLGLAQGGSYLWMIGNDFTRYWNIADAIRGWEGYPGMITLPDFAAIGEPPYTIDLPVFGITLIPAFGIFGHDTFAAYIPNLAANALLPLLLFAFYRGAGIGTPIAFAGSCALTTMPFLRLYTLNAPLPDTIFITLLVATVVVYERIIASKEQASEKREARSEAGDLPLPLGGPSDPPLPLGDSPNLPLPLGEGRGEGVLLPGEALSEGKAGRGEGVLLHGEALPEGNGGRGEDRPQHPSLIAHRSLLAWLLLGVLAGLTALTRSEGPVLLGFVALGLLPDLRRKGPWIAAAAAAALLLPCAAVMYSNFHILWPNNAGSVFSPAWVGDHVRLLRFGLMRRYAEALAMPEGLFAGAVLALAICVIAGTIWLARHSWRLALLPVGGAVSFYLVMMVDPAVSGVRLWFDFFRHISYGLPFLSLAPLFLIDRLSRLIGGAALSAGNCGAVRSGARARAANVLAVALVAISLWQLSLLMRPSQTHGAGGTQLLNSDVWVTVQDLAARRFELPVLPHARDSQGVLLIEPRFDRDYLMGHLDRVRQFFEPYTVINTNRGSQYEVSSALLVLFGTVFALSRSRRE